MIRHHGYSHGLEEVFTVRDFGGSSPTDELRFMEFGVLVGARPTVMRGFVFDVVYFGAYGRVFPSVNSLVGRYAFFGFGSPHIGIGIHAGSDGRSGSGSGTVDGIAECSRGLPEEHPARYV